MTVVAEETKGDAPSSKYKPRLTRKPSGVERVFLGIRKVIRFVWPQWLRTTLLVILWLSVSPVYVGLIASYDVYGSATSMTVGLAIFSGMAPHLWRSRTSPWRTVAWTALMTSVLGMGLLTMGADRYSLMIVTMIGFLFIILRANENGRKLWRMVQTWRFLR